MSIILKPVSDLYKKLVHIEGENAYPWLDRAISYGLPTLGAVLWSALGTHEKIKISDKSEIDYSLFAKDYSTWGLPAGLAFYGATQVGLNYLKPLVEPKEDDTAVSKTIKKIGDLGVKAADALNNIVPYVIAHNILPKTNQLNTVYANQLNTVYAFKAMPKILEGIESDIKAKVNGTKYEGEVAGEIYSSIVGGFVSKTLAAELAKKFKNGDDETFDSIFVDSVVDGFTFPVMKKILIGKSYGQGEFSADFYRSTVQNFMYGSTFFADDKVLPKALSDATKDSVFNNIAFFTAVELATLLLDEGANILEIATEIADEIKDAGLIAAGADGSL